MLINSVGVQPQIHLRSKGVQGCCPDKWGPVGIACGLRYPRFLCAENAMKTYENGAFGRYSVFSSLAVIGDYDIQFTIHKKVPSGRTVTLDVSGNLWYTIIMKCSGCSGKEKT